MNGAWRRGSPCLAHALRRTAGAVVLGWNSPEAPESAVRDGASAVGPTRAVGAGPPGALGEGPARAVGPARALGVGPTGALRHRIHLPSVSRSIEVCVGRPLFCDRAHTGADILMSRGLTSLRAVGGV